MSHLHGFNATICEEVHLDYFLSVPQQYKQQPREHFPLILYLHGSQLRFDGVEQLHAHGVPRRALMDASFPFIVLAPHCPPNTDWTYLAAAVEKLLQHVEANYRVDRSRIYVTGLSMGGGGAWCMGAAFPERFAAMLSVCAYAPREIGFPERASELKHVPVWAFHGTEDAILPFAESQQLVDALNSAEGNAQLTPMSNRGHDIWEDVYQDDAVYQWLLSHQNNHG